MDAIRGHLQSAHDLGVSYAQTMLDRAQEKKLSLAQMYAFFLQRARGIVSGVVDRVQSVLADAVTRAKDAGVSIAESVLEAADHLFEHLPDGVAGDEVHAGIEQAVLETLQDAGKKKKQCVTSPGACEVCLGNEEQGAIDIDAPFASGQKTAPFHDHCRCSVQDA